ncbi:MAG TPA: acyl-CoA dehydrogenase family protein [Ilumatobacteraceae bacterium]|nr:acyl-CoA dehydrogenase family protein [Ilumatobacteraceae bacterium]
MSADEADDVVSRLTVDDVAHVRQAVRDVASSVPRDTDAIQRERRLPDDLVERLRSTGINRLVLPTELGGYQASVLDVLDVAEELAAADGSTGWCAALGSGSNLLAGYIPEAGARRVFADPDQGNATMFAPAGTLVDVDGTLRLSGRWPFVSNCLHSAWIGLGALSDGHGPAGPPTIVWVPVSELQIEETWDSDGLRGTGSHDVVADDVVVDPDHCCTFADTPWATGTLWRLTPHSVFLPILATLPLGIAWGALDEIARQVREGRQARRGNLADDPVALASYGDADTRLRGATTGLRDLVRQAEDLAEAHEPIGRTLQARISLAAIQACDVAVDVTSTAHQLGGGAAAYRPSTLLRALADVQAARQHLLFAPKHRVELAKAAAGLDVTYPPFVV